MISADITKKDQRFLLQFLLAEGVPVGTSDISTLHGDGSDRRFYRVQGGTKLVAVFPSLSHPKKKEEARSTYLIGYHLQDLGVAVPKIMAHDRVAGLVLFEDVGDEHLQARVQGAHDDKEKTVLFQQAIDALLTFQIDGVRGFDIRSCWDTSCYDYELMVTRESDYFLQALCRDYAGQDFNGLKVKQECMAIAHRASREPAHYLLHRDYQSRNLMVYEGAIRIIDFQGARLGPLGYDLASLLFDPYVQLSHVERETIFEYYVKEASLRLTLDFQRFKDGYQYLALQRVMQMLGAFGFLTVHRGKIFFEEFIIPALDNLRYLLRHCPDTYPYLLALVDDVQANINECRYFSSP